MNNKILKFIANRIVEEAEELDADIYQGTYTKLLILADLLKELAEEE